MASRVKPLEQESSSDNVFEPSGLGELENPNKPNSKPNNSSNSQQRSNEEEIIDENKQLRYSIKNGNFFTKYSQIRKIRSILNDNEITYDESIMLLNQLEQFTKDKTLRFEVFKCIQVNLENDMDKLREFVRKANEILNLSGFATVETFVNDLLNNKCNLKIGLTPEQQEEVDRIKAEITQKENEKQEINLDITQLKRGKKKLEGNNTEADNQIAQIDKKTQDFTLANEKYLSLDQEVIDLNEKLTNLDEEMNDHRNNVFSNWKAYNKGKRKYYNFLKQNQEEEDDEEEEHDHETSSSEKMSSDSDSDGHTVKITRFGFHLFCLLIVSGGMTISGTMVPVSPFDFNSTNNILFYVLPMIFASLSSFISIFFKEIFNSEKRLFMTIINIIFVILTVCLHLSTKIIPLYLTIRTFQGIIVGLMSFIYPITLKQVCTKKLYKTYFVAFFLFFCIGLFVFRSIGAHWIKLICIVPFMQSLLIWISEKKHYKRIEFRDYNCCYVESPFLTFDTIGRYLIHAFTGSLTFWIGINRYNSDNFSVFKLTITFILPMIVFLIIIRKLTARYDILVHFYYIFSFVLYFIGGGLVIEKLETEGFYVIAAANGAGLFFFCWDHYIIYNSHPISTFPLSCVLFWLFNGLSSLIYLKTTPFVWFIVGISVLGAYILILILSPFAPLIVYIYLKFL